MNKKMLSKLASEEVPAFLAENDLKKITSHEPNEELLSVDDAFADADLSEARWQAFEINNMEKTPLTNGINADRSS